LSQGVGRSHEQDHAWPTADALLTVRANFSTRTSVFVLLLLNETLFATIVNAACGVAGLLITRGEKPALVQNSVSIKLHESA
jgi:hypothetical protein